MTYLVIYDAIFEIASFNPFRSFKIVYFKIVDVLSLVLLENCVIGMGGNSFALQS